MVAMKEEKRPGPNSCLENHSGLTWQASDCYRFGRGIWRTSLVLTRRMKTCYFIGTWITWLADQHSVQHVSRILPSGSLTYMFRGYVKQPEDISGIVQSSKAMGPTVHHQPGPARLPHARPDSAFWSTSDWWTKGPFANKESEYGGIPK